MSAVCPNINSPEWKKLEESVGKFEAYRDFMETGEIRTPEQVKDKLASRSIDQVMRESEFTSDPSFAEIFNKTQQGDDVIGTNQDQLKNGRAIEFANKVSDALGIEYSIVSASEAAEITGKSLNQWSGQPAFFVGGKVYFLQDRMSSDLVLHEFAHPFLRAISVDNPELFNNLYNKLSETATGHEIIASVLETHPELDKNSDYFKEEVLVQALEKAAEEVKKDDGFLKVIQNLFYALKQALRKAFGRKLELGGLSPQTTLNELATILTDGGQISINTEAISQEDIVAYNNDVFNEIVKDMENIKRPELQMTIDKFYNTMSAHLNMLMKNENYEELREILTDDYLRSDIQEIRANLSKYKSDIMEASEDLLEDITESKNRVQALTTSLMRFGLVMEKMQDHLEDMKDNLGTQENVHKAYYYNKMINHWEELITQVDEVLIDRENQVPSDSPVNSLVKDIETNLKRSKQIINKMYAEGSRDALYDQLEPLHRAVTEKYESMIAKLREGEMNDVKRKKIDDLYKEYHGLTQAELGDFNSLMRKQKTNLLNSEERARLANLTMKHQRGLSISKEKIEASLLNDAKDANFFNSYLEGYLYNTDPVVGGLGLYVKNALNEVMIVTMQKGNTFANDMRPLLRAAGYNPNKIGDLGSKIGFRDKTFKRDPETGKFVEHEVWSFIDKFKNYRYDEAMLKQAVEEAGRNYMDSQSQEDKLTYAKAKADYLKWQRDYMYQQYVDEFYEKDKLFEDEVGLLAKQSRDEFFERLRSLTAGVDTQSQEIDMADSIDEMWREYKQMFSRRDLNGKMKTGQDAAIAQRLREYRDATRDFYEFRLKKGVFENAYFSFLEELRHENVQENSEEWNARVSEWKRLNSRRVVKDEWYEQRNFVINQVKEILSKLKDADERSKLDQSAIWEDIIEMTAGFRDEDNQIDASLLSDDVIAKIKTLQEKLKEMKDEEMTPSGLTGIEKKELNALWELRNNKKPYNTKRFNELTLKQKKGGLNKTDIAALKGLYQELRDMTSKEATDHYVSVANNWLSKLDTTALEEKYNIKSVDKISAEYLLDMDVADALKKQSPEFQEWFDANHMIRTRYDSEQGMQVEEYERLYIWSLTKPSDPAMMESYTIEDHMGNVVDTIQGLPANKFYNRVVKTKYRTRNIPGVTKDNRGNFLPKTMADGALDNKYQNEKYEQMKRQDPALFAVLEKMKEHHLKNQEGLSYNSKLYMDMPRYRKSTLEVLQTTTLRQRTEKKVNAISLLAKRIKDFIYGSADMAGEELNWDQRMKYSSADLLDNDVTGIPISGLHDIDTDDVSTDITTGMMRYMASAEHQKKLIKISPIVRAIQATVNNQEFAKKTLNDVARKEMGNRNLLKFFDKGKNGAVRAAAVNNFVEKNFEGKNNTGLGKDQAWLHNFSGLLFKRASFTFFALNLPSALKNSFGMMFQNMIEAAGGRYVDPISLTKGNTWSFNAMKELSFKGGIYERGTKNHTLQLIDIFDPIQGRFEEKFGTEMSRTIGKDVASFSWLYSPRKWVEIQASLQLFGGMMHKVKVSRRMSDGSVQEIPYIEAFETVDGQIRLKDGIDARYSNEPVFHTVLPADTLESIADRYNTTVEVIENSLKGKPLSDMVREAERLEYNRESEIEEVQDEIDRTEDEATKTKLMDRIDAINNKYDRKAEEQKLKIDNSEFKFNKNRIHQVMNNMGGAYSKFDQPEAQRYILFRFISYLRRYFTTMAMNRWGFSGPLTDPRPRLNPGLGDAQMGFYIQFMKTLLEAVRTGGKNIPYMNSDEKVAAIKFGTEVGMLMMTTLMMGLLFGWDPEDDERYEKLRAQSGALPFPLTAKDENRDFDLLGYAELHALHLLMQVRAENEQFNLLTGGLHQYNSMLDLKSIAFGPTTDSYLQMYDDMKNIVTGDPKANYTRKVGPYDWQQQGGSKFLTHMARTFGLTGTTLDPALAIQNFQSFQAKAKR